METDIAIIGAGPVGLFAAFQSGMLGLRACIIDALPEAGGQCTALYPEKPVYDIPGCPEITASELVDNLTRQAGAFEPEYLLGQRAEKLEREGEYWNIVTSEGMQIKASAVIVASGGGAFGPNRPPLDNIKQFEGHSVFYMVRRRDDFAGKRIVIAGGGDSAVDWALSLSGIAEKVYVIHRRDRFRAAPQSVNMLRQKAEEGRVELVIPYQLRRIEGEGGEISAVTVVSPEGQEKRIEADILLPFYGLASDPGPLSDWGLEMEQGRIIVDPSTCQTNLRDIYAAGDAAQYPGKLRLMLTGFADAAQAVYSAYKTIRGDDRRIDQLHGRSLPS